MRHDVLGGEDAAWLHMEDETNPMVVTGVLELAERLPPDRVHALVAQLASLPRFRSRVVEPRRRFGRPSFEEVTGFDFTRHVEEVTLASADDAALREFIGKAVSSLLPRDRPLWRLYVIERPACGTTFLYRFHHALGDGFAFLSILLALCEGVEARALPKPVAHQPVATALACVKALARIVILPPDPMTVLKGALGREKAVAWSAPIPLAGVKTCARAMGATVNDVLVAAAAGAIGRYLERRDTDVGGLEIRAMLPVDLRGGIPARELGNRFGLFVAGLPVGIRDPVARVRAVKRRMDALKGSAEGLTTYAILGAMGRAPRPLEALGVSYFGSKTSVVLTNVPGPRDQVRLAGVPVKRMLFWVPQSGHTGLGISIFSYAGSVTIGILVDVGLVSDVNALVADLHAELEALHVVAVAAAA